MIHINGKDYLFAKCTGYVPFIVLHCQSLNDAQRVRVVENAEGRDNRCRVFSTS
jgi:hypothetical protein